MKLFVYFISIVFFVSCVNKTSNKSSIKLVEKVFEFGKRTHNDTIRHVFKIKNMSNVDYIIDKVAQSCGCTTVKFTEGKVKENAFANIEIIYVPTVEEEGLVSKSVVVSDNSVDGFQVLYLKGEITK